MISCETERGIRFSLSKESKRSKRPSNAEPRLRHCIPISAGVSQLGGVAVAVVSLAISESEKDTCGSPFRLPGTPAILASQVPRHRVNGSDTGVVDGPATNDVVGFLRLGISGSYLFYLIRNAET